MSSPGRLRVVIAGTGPVGLMTAALLARDRRLGGAGIRVIGGAAPGAWSAETTDLRVYALSRASQVLFDELGLWDEISRRRVSPYRDMRVWEGPDCEGVASIHFEAATVGEPDLGHIVEDVLLRDVLLAWLARQPAVRVDHDSPLTGFERGGRRARVIFGDGETVQADLLIGADGADSVVRRLAGIGTIRRAYGQRALVAHVFSMRPHRETAWQRFGARGPLALLPLADGASSVVWSVSDADAAVLEAMDDAAFGHELTAASAGVLGDLTLASPRASFPLALSHATRYVTQSVALAGDAAHAVHPLAGQGMNLGLLDAAALAETVARAAADGHYIGDRYVLGRYARVCRGRNLAMQLAFDAIDRLSRAGEPLAALRTAGMLAAGALPGVKRLLIDAALGRAVPVSRL